MAKEKPDSWRMCVTAAFNTVKSSAGSPVKPRDQSQPQSRYQLQLQTQTQTQKPASLAEFPSQRFYLSQPLLFLFGFYVINIVYEYYVYLCLCLCVPFSYIGPASC